MDKKKRLFIAINLPENIKDKLEKLLEGIRFDFTNDIRFLERKNWHITVTFLGYQKDELIPEMIKCLKETTKKIPAPIIDLSDLSYGPKGALPRMIWLNGSAAASKTLADLKGDLENRLIDRGVNFKQEHRRFHLHITLARFPEAKNLPEISRKLNWQFLAGGLDLMESHLSRDGANYEVLHSEDFQLK